MVNDGIATALTARAALYHAFHILFANEPSDATLGILLGSEFGALAGAYLGEDAPALREAAKEARAVADEGASGIEALQGAYNRLFVGPGKPQAGPWESLYANKEATLFTRETLEVRKCYVRHGFIPQSYPHVADDHVALELDFMAQLARKACADHADGDVEGARFALDAAREFLDAHLGVWLPRFAAALHAAPSGRLYRQVADLLTEFARCDREALGDLLAAMPAS